LIQNTTALPNDAEGATTDQIDHFEVTR